MEGSHYNPKNVFANFNLSSDATYGGHVSMLMAKLKRTQGSRWEFTALGQPITAKDIAGTIKLIQNEYL